MFLRVLLKQHAFSSALSKLQLTLLAVIQIKLISNDLAPYVGHFLNSVRQPYPPPSAPRPSSLVWEKRTVCPLVYSRMSKKIDQTLLRISDSSKQCPTSIMQLVFTFFYPTDTGGLHVLWPLEVHSDKGTSMEYLQEPYVYWWTWPEIECDHLYCSWKRSS